jgi:hypothetical protein
MDGIRGVTGPIPIEIARNVLDNRAYGHDVEIDEEHTVGCAEVFISDVAAANNGHLIISRKRFVVHAAIQAMEVGQVAEHTRLANDEGVEETHLDVAASIESCQSLVKRRCTIIVEQQSNADATVRCLARASISKLPDMSWCQM